MARVKVLANKWRENLFFLLAQLFQLFPQLLDFLSQGGNAAILFLANDFENLVELGVRGQRIHLFDLRHAIFGGGTRPTSGWGQSWQSL